MKRTLPVSPACRRANVAPLLRTIVACAVVTFPYPLGDIDGGVAWAWWSWAGELVGVELPNMLRLLRQSEVSIGFVLCSEATVV
jgi:hypothetical protein